MRVGEPNPKAEELNRVRDDLIQEFSHTYGSEAPRIVSILERFIDANIKWATDKRY